MAYHDASSASISRLVINCKGFGNRELSQPAKLTVSFGTDQIVPKTFAGLGHSMWPYVNSRHSGASVTAW